MSLLVFFAFVWTKRQSQGHGSGFAHWSFTIGVQTSSCIDGDKEESSEKRPEGIQVAYRPPGCHHLSTPHEQLARIRKESPECRIYKGLVEEGAWGTSRQREAAKGGLTCQPESQARGGQGVWTAQTTSWPLIWLSQREKVGSARNGISVGNLKVEFENPK